MAGLVEDRGEEADADGFGRAGAHVEAFDGAVAQAVGRRPVAEARAVRLAVDVGGAGVADVVAACAQNGEEYGQGAHAGVDYSRGDRVLQPLDRRRHSRVAST